MWWWRYAACSTPRMKQDEEAWAQAPPPRAAELRQSAPSLPTVAEQAVVTSNPSAKPHSTSASPVSAPSKRGAASSAPPPEADLAPRRDLHCFSRRRRRGRRRPPWEKEGGWWRARGGAGRWPASDPVVKLRLVDGEDGEGGMAVMVKQSCKVEGGGWKDERREEIGGNFTFS
jgi:hypothetical protein